MKKNIFKELVTKCTLTISCAFICFFFLSHICTRMKYRSTRGGVSGLSFEDALYTGYASDGGILMPEVIPTVTKDVLKSWVNLSYTQLAKVIVPYFISEDEIPKSDLEALLDQAFSRFTHPDIAPISHLKDGLNIMELYHGVTWAFKDLALSCCGQFLEYFLSKRKKHLTILVGTSGDTGSAAIEAVRGMKWVDIVVLLPRGRCSKTQELQMTSVIEDNVHVYRVDGTSDDLDIPIKQCFMDTEFCQKYNLCSINSINWARIMVQTVHYFYAYLQLCPSCEEELEVVIPTGACGNVTSGFVARMMGLPVIFVCAVTKNDIVARTIQNGDFSVAENVIPTLAPAMDIQLPYNMERIWHMVTDGDHVLIKRLMDEFEKNRKLKVPTAIAEKVRNIIVNTFVASDEDVKKMMNKVWRDNDKYLTCPHTAVGVAYHFSDRNGNKKNGRKSVIIATASVIKFEEALEAAGLTVPTSDAVKSLLSKPTRYQDMNKGDNWYQMLRSKIESINKTVDI